MKPLHIYADNASTTQLDPDALEAMLPFMRDGFANPRPSIQAQRRPGMLSRMPGA
jgi:cysteine sulfinate desulfinase/cysteine desulfurase-like protein